MKTCISAVVIYLATVSLVLAQNPSEAKKRIDEGIELHDQNDFAGAIAKYDQALQLDADNLEALAEKALSLFSLKKIDECIEYCEKAIRLYPDDPLVKMVYVTCGNAYDASGKPKESIKVYDKGIKQFPDFYLLYFNKGITLSGNAKTDEALSCFETSVKANPNHASSHQAIARINQGNKERVPSILAYCRFLVLEPESRRAQENLVNLQKLLRSNVEETGKNSVTIVLDPNTIKNSTDRKPKANNFAMIDMILSMDAALDYDEKYKEQSDVQKFHRKIETICSSLKESAANNSGFYWEYYAPYFIELKDNSLTEVFSYVVFKSSDDVEVSDWLSKHEKDIGRLADWSKSFQWKQGVK